MNNTPQGGNKRTFGANLFVKVNVNVNEDPYFIRSSNR
jgi:hypothetical protein